MPSINLFGSAMRGKSRAVTSEERTNLFMEKTVDGDKYEVAYYSRPGLTQVNPAAGVSGGQPPGPHGPPLGVGPMLEVPGSGSISVGEVLWVARKDGWELWTDGGTRLSATGGAGGDATPQTNFVSFAYGGGGASVNRGFAVDGVDAWWMTTSGISTVVPVSVIGGFPWTGATSVTYLAGRLICDAPEYPGRFAWSPLELFIGQTWGGLDYATAESSPDPLVAVQAFRGELILFGTTTTEFWAPSPTRTFANIQGTTAPWGLLGYSQSTIGIVGDKLFFLGKTANGRAQVCVLNGYKPQVVSTPDVEYLINVENDLSLLKGNAFTILGHDFYTLSLSNKTLVFDATSGDWSYWSTDGARWAGQFVVECFGRHMVFDYRDQRAYELAPDTYSDDGGTSFVREIVGRHVFSDMERVTVNEILLDIETGEGPPIWEGSPPVERQPEVMMQLSKDGGRTFGYELWETLGKVGDYKRMVNWTRLGRARDLVFKFRVADPVKVTFMGAAARISTRGGQGG